MLSLVTRDAPDSGFYYELGSNSIAGPGAAKAQGSADTHNGQLHALQLAYILRKLPTCFPETLFSVLCCVVCLLEFYGAPIATVIMRPFVLCR